LSRADYGIDRPDFLISAGALGSALVISGTVDSQLLPLAAVGAVLILFALVFLWDSKSLKPRRMKRLIDSLQWRGDENVLDVGCGRGLFLVSSAKHLHAGSSQGIDLWRARLQTGNSPSSALANALVEGVAPNVGVEEADARYIPFADSTFDVVFASLVLHHIGRASERRKALAEIERVLKPRGLVVIVDSYLSEHSKELASLGISDQRILSWGPLSFMGTRVLTAKRREKTET